MEFPRNTTILVSFLSLLLLSLLLIGEATESSFSWTKRTPFHPCEYGLYANFSDDLNGIMDGETKNNFHMEYSKDCCSSMTQWELKECSYLEYLQQDAIRAREGGSRRRKEFKRGYMERKNRNDFSTLTLRFQYNSNAIHEILPTTVPLVSKSRRILYSIKERTRVAGRSRNSSQLEEQKPVYQNASLIHGVESARRNSRKQKNQKMINLGPSGSSIVLYAAFVLLVGFVVLGLLLVSDRDAQLQNTTSQQIDTNASSTSQAQSSSRLYLFGAISSTLAIIVFLIHFCVGRWHRTGH